MRRPRAFTCSRLRAEPLPPPPRKPLGYLHEEGWTIRSSSPCQCGSCGRDSPPRSVSTPPRTGSQQQDGLPQNASMHQWGPASSPACPKTPGSPHVPFVSENSMIAAGAGGEVSLATGCAPPARRIVLFGEPEVGNPRPEVAFFGRQSAELDGTKEASSPPVQSERKRGNESSESSYVQVQRGQSSGMSLLSVSAPTASGDRSRGQSLIAGAAFSAGSARVKTIAGPFGSSSSVSPAIASDALPDTASSGVADLVPGTNAGAEIETDTASQTQLRYLPATVVELAKSQPAPFHERLNLRYDFPHAGNSPDTATGFPTDNAATNDTGLNLEEWKAPETVGTFSLGSSGKEAGVSRRRRVLRMRVGG